MDLAPLGVGNGVILDAIHLRIGHDNAGKLAVAAVGAELGAAAEAGDLGEVEVQNDALQPVNGISGEPANTRMTSSRTNSRA